MKYKELDELAENYNIRKSKDRDCIEYTSENRSFRIKILEINKKIKIMNFEGYLFDVGTPDFEFMKKAIELAETPLEERMDKPDLEYWKDSEIEVGDRYYYLEDSRGVVCWTLFEESAEDKWRVKTHQAFKTKEGAEFEKERIKVVAELEEYSREFAYDNDNYAIRYNFISENLEILCYRQSISHELYFESKEKAEEAIEAVGKERVKKYYLQIKDQEEEE